MGQYLTISGKTKSIIIAAFLISVFIIFRSHFGNGGNQLKYTYSPCIKSCIEDISYDPKNIASYEVIERAVRFDKPISLREIPNYSKYELETMAPDYRIEYSIVISPNISLETFKSTIKKFIYEQSDYATDVDSMLISVFSTKDTKVAYSVIDWAPEGNLSLVTPEIAKNNDRSNYKAKFRYIDLELDN